MIDPNTNQPRSAQGKVAIDPAWSPLRCEKLVTFAGGTTGAWGDDGGALDGAAIFTVTGTVRMRLIGICETNVAGAGTIEIGVTGGTATLIAQVADATDIDAGNIWHDATTDAFVELSSVATEKIVANGLDVLLTVTTANLTSGAIRFICSWYPLSAGASVVPSTN